jgi:hypothetical protein
LPFCQAPQGMPVRKSGLQIADFQAFRGAKEHKMARASFFWFVFLDEQKNEQVNQIIE